MEQSTHGFSYRKRFSPARRGGGESVEMPTFLMPVLVGGAEWSVTPGHINNVIPTCEGQPMVGSDPAEWAARIASEGGIWASCEFSLGQGESQPSSSNVNIVFSASTPASTAYIGYYLIGWIFNIGEGDTPAWEVVPFNASSLQATVNGGTWIWMGPGTEWIPQSAKEEAA